MKSFDYFRRDDETLLLLKSESMSMDSPRDQYTPLQYENSLGKLQAVTVKAPRKIIDVMGVLNQDAEQLSSAQKVFKLAFQPLIWEILDQVMSYYLHSFVIFKNSNSIN